MASFTIQSGIFVGLILVVAAPYVIADRCFGLSHPWPTLIGLGSLIAILTSGLYWLIALQRKARTVTYTSRHAVFGEVRHFNDHWEATVDLSPHGSVVEVWGEALDPTASESETFIAIRQRLPELLALIPNQLVSWLPSSSLTPGIGDLHLGSILLSATTTGNFDLSFALPKHERIFPWGITVTFANFTVDEVSDNH